MSVQTVLRMGDPRLRRPAQPVEDVNAEKIQTLIGNLRDTMNARSGAGLAAPQIGEPWRVVLLGTGLPNPRYPDAPIIPETVLINPELEPIGEETQLGWEGCLSVPGLRGQVKRWQRIRLRALNSLGEPVDRVVEGFEARVIQHECDHLNGVLFPDRLSSTQAFGFIEELIEDGQISSTVS